MANVFSIVSPILLVVIAGFISVRIGWVSRANNVALGQFVFYIALPALFIGTLAKTPIHSALSKEFLAIYGVGMFTTFFLMVLFSLFVVGDGLRRTAVKAMGSCFPNSVFVGFALLLQIYDHPPIATLAMALLVENILMMPIAVGFLEYSIHGGEGVMKTVRTVFLGLAFNPIITAIVIGFALALLNIPMPHVFRDSLEMLGKAASGTALFVVGGTLASSKLRGDIPDILQICCAKLIIHPLLVGGLILLAPPFDPALQMAVILFSSCAMFSVYPLFGSRYGEPDLTNGAMLVTYVVSLFSITTVLFLVT